MLKSGVVVYIYPDRERPLIDLTIHIKGGSYLDPKGKEGLAVLTGSLMAQEAFLPSRRMSWTRNLSFWQPG